MTRSLETHNKFMAYWHDEVKSNATNAQIVNFVLYFLFITQPIGVFILARQVDHHFIIYLVGLAAYIPTCIYIFFNLRRLPNEIEKGHFKNLTKNLPEGLEKISLDILNTFQLPVNHIEYWINPTNLAISPTLVSHKGKYHVILPVGFLKILSENEDHARHILAHELSHIRQRDSDLLITFKTFLNSTFFFFVPILFLNFLFSIFLNIDRLNDADDRRGAAISQTIAYSLPLDNYFSAERYYNDAKTQIIINLVTGFLFLLGILFALRKARQMIYRSERLADLGAALVGSPARMIDTIQAYASIKKATPFFNINPTPAWRIEQLSRESNHFPGTNTEALKSDVVLESFQSRLSLLKLTFCAFAIIIFPFGYVVTVFQAMRGPDIPDQYEFLYVIDFLIQLSLVSAGIVVGLGVLKQEEGATSKARWFCVANLIYIVGIISFMIALAKEVDTTMIYSTLKLYGFRSALFGGGIILFLKDRTSSTNVYHDFSTYLYSPAASQTHLKFTRWERYLLIFLSLISVEIFIWSYYEHVDVFELPFFAMEYGMDIGISLFVVIALSWIHLAAAVLAVVYSLYQWKQKQGSIKLLMILLSFYAAIILIKVLSFLYDYSTYETSEIDSGTLLHFFYGAIFFSAILFWLRLRLFKSQHALFINTLLGISLCNCVVIGCGVWWII